MQLWRTGFPLSKALTTPDLGLDGDRFPGLTCSFLPARGIFPVLKMPFSLFCLFTNTETSLDGLAFQSKSLRVQGRGPTLEIWELGVQGLRKTVLTSLSSTLKLSLVSRGQQHWLHKWLCCVLPDLPPYTPLSKHKDGDFSSLLSPEALTRRGKNGQSPAYIVPSSSSAGSPSSAILNLVGTVAPELPHLQASLQTAGLMPRPWGSSCP